MQARRASGIRSALIQIVQVKIIIHSQAAKRVPKPVRQGCHSLSNSSHTLSTHNTPPKKEVINSEKLPKCSPQHQRDSAPQYPNLVPRQARAPEQRRIEQAHKPRKFLSTSLPNRSFQSKTSDNSAPSLTGNISKLPRGTSTMQACKSPTRQVK